jgi:hypothetical protein
MQTLFKHYARFIDGAAKEERKAYENFLLVAEGPQKGPYLEIVKPETLAAQGF